MLRILLLALLLAPFGPSQSVRVAAAADLKWALEAVLPAFEQAHPGIRVVVSYGSSGSFHAQLRQRAPFDLFLSADLAYAQDLADRGLAEPPFRYARGPLALWVRQDSPLDLQREGLRALADPRVRRIAIANPKHAPYGRAAEHALRTAGLLEQLRPKLVIGENVAQAAQFVQAGAADAGILALSLATAPVLRTQGRFLELPAQLAPPLEQGGTILAWARDPAAARAFRAFLTGAEGRRILARFGFKPPGG